MIDTCQLLSMEYFAFPGLLLLVLNTFPFCVSFVPDYGFGLGGLVSGEYHVDVTRDAMKYVASQLFNELTTRPQGSNRIPLDDNLFGKNGLSENQIFTYFYAAKVSAKSFSDAVAAIKVGAAKVDHDAHMKNNPHHHFDAERFDQANKVIEDLRFFVYHAIKAESYAEARETFGILLHTLQDFYSHSNWVELGNTEPNPHLGKTGQTFTRIAPPDMPTCDNCTRKCLWKICSTYTCESNIFNQLKAENRLTSGYFGGQFDGTKDVVKPHSGKCSHGGLFDGTQHEAPVGGINKDSRHSTISPHYYLHEQAMKLARLATIDFTHRLRQSVRDDYKFGTFLGLFVSASLALVVDVSSSMSDNIADVKEAIFKHIDQSTVSVFRPRNYIFVPFNDPDFGPVAQTNDAEHMKDIIRNLQVGERRNSFEGPDMCMNAINLASESSEVGSKIFVFTDALPKDVKMMPRMLLTVVQRRQSLHFLHNILGYSRKKRQSNVNDVYEFFNGLALKTGGSFITYDSDVSSLFNASSVVNIFRYPSRTLLNVSFQVGEGNEFSFEVDDSVTSFTITSKCSQEFPIIRFVSPDGRASEWEQVSILHDQYVTMNTINTGSSSVGRWRVKVMVSNSRCSVIVAAATNLYTTTNLMVMDNSSNHPGLQTIIGKPKVGDNVTAVFSISESSASLDSIRIRDATNDQQIIESDLDPMGDTGQFYMSFNMPLSPISITISGKDVGGNTVATSSDVPIQHSFYELKRVAAPNATSTVNIAQGGSATVQVNVTNFNTQASSTVVSIAVEDSAKYVESFYPQMKELDPFESFTVNLVFRIPRDAPIGMMNTATVYAGTGDIDTRNSLLIYVTVTPPQGTDDTNPRCQIVNSTYSDVCAVRNSNCMFQSWVSHVVFYDKYSGFNSITMDFANGRLAWTVTPEKYHELRSRDVFVKVAGDCCLSRASMIVYNKHLKESRCTFL